MHARRSVAGALALLVGAVLLGTVPTASAAPTVSQERTCQDLDLEAATRLGGVRLQAGTYDLTADGITCTRAARLVEEWADDREVGGAWDVEEADGGDDELTFVREDADGDLDEITLEPDTSTATALADPRWSMVPMSKDPNGDGFIDGDGGVPESGALTRSPSSTFVGEGNLVAQPNERLIGGALSWYLNPNGFPVELNACQSEGDTFAWRIRSGARVVKTTPNQKLDRESCRRTVLLPEGSYSLELTVRAGQGRPGRTERSVETISADVVNHLIVAFGDSYASGQGNPRNVDAWLANRTDTPAFDPYWDDRGCSRSTRGAPAQAALQLENSSPYTSVTLVDVACTGSTADVGVLGPKPLSGKTVSQIEEVRAIIGDRAIDAVTISIGGNDVGVGPAFESCLAALVNCPLRPSTNDPLTGYPTLHAAVQTLIAGLPESYAQIAGCLGGSSCVLADGSSIPPLRLSTGAPVLPTLYQDLTRAADGSSCRYLTMSPQDFAWARATMQVPTPQATFDYRQVTGQTVSLPITATVNQQVAATSALGWLPVTGTWTSSGDSTVGHGVCAGDDAWVFGITTRAGFAEASLHPNPAGQVALAAPIAAALITRLAPR